MGGWDLIGVLKGSQQPMACQLPIPGLAINEMTNIHFLKTVFERNFLILQLPLDQNDPQDLLGHFDPRTDS